MARFDWYQATVRVEPREVLDGFSSWFHGSTSWQDMPKAPQGYGFGRRLLDEDGELCQVWWGGCQDYPHVRASGDSSPAVADALRATWPGHRVSRADVCQDYAEPGAYDRLQELALAVARDGRVKVGTAGDHLLTKQGRTLYLGSESSVTRLRLYDKRAELAQKFRNQPDRLADLPPELARLEVQVRPKGGESMERVSKADPIALMGSANWTRQYMRLVDGLELEPFQAGRAWRQQDDTRSYAAMLAMFGGLLQRMGNEQGPCGLGRQILSDLAERAALRAR